jgi:hypothetical protein
MDQENMNEYAVERIERFVIPKGKGGMLFRREESEISG